MKLSGAEQAFALLLAASLSGKLLASRAAAPEPGEVSLNAQTSALLRDDGFAVTPEQYKFGTMLRGERPGCRLLAGGYDPHGTFAERFRQLAADVGPLRFAYRGRVYDTAPKVRPLFEYFGARELRRIGVPAPRTPIVAFAASAGCDLSGLRWQRVGVLS